MRRLIDFLLVVAGVVVMWFMFGGWLLVLLGGCR